MGVIVSSSHIVSAASSSSVSSPDPSCSPSHGRVLHELLQRESLPRAAVLHKLLQCESLPGGAVLQEQAAPARVPHGVTSPASKPALTWGPQGITAFFRHPPALACGPARAGGGDLLGCACPWARGVQPALPGSSPQAAG